MAFLFCVKCWKLNPRQAEEVSYILKTCNTHFLMIGHIKIDRKILQWEWFQESNMLHLFIYLLLKANHKEGKWQGNIIKRGQLITGTRKLATSTGLSEMQIRTCLKKLKLTKEITIKSTNKFSLITICKYDSYQNKKDDSNKQDNEQITSETTFKQHSNNIQITTNKNDKEDKNEFKEENPENKLWFLRFYHSPYETYKNIFNGKSCEEPVFQHWRKFIDFIYENKYEELFECKFLNPHDFGILVSKKKFTEDKWDETLKKILSTGVKPEHNLFFRIPEFMNYGKSQSVTTVDKQNKNSWI